MSETWTIRRVLDWTAKDFAGRGLDSPRLDAELIIAHALGIDRVRVYMDLDRPLASSELGAIRELVGRRRKREPIAYIVGRREFYGRSFEVTPAVLIPRPDTETLIERALELLPQDAAGSILDLGTGPGILAITLLAEREGLCADAVDVSRDAIEVARRNASKLGVADRIAFHEGDLFAPLSVGARYAMIVSNPPYIPEREIATLEPDVRDYEPRVALSGGDDGLAIVRRIVEGAAEWLEPSGALLLEVGADQAGAVVELMRAQPALCDVTTRFDLGQIERVVEARRIA